MNKLQRILRPWGTKIIPRYEDPGVVRSKLHNGLTVATETRVNSPYVCIGLYIDAGSRYEKKTENGIAHFFQHLVFNRTYRRNKAELQKAITSSGANFGSFTTREMVCFYVQCLKSQVPLATDILCDCVFNTALSDVEINKQKTNVYYEMLEYEKDQNTTLYDYLHSAAFQGTPLEQTVMGPSTNLYHFRTCAIEDYMCRFFDPCRTVLAAVGGVRHEYMVHLANWYLTCLQLKNLCVEQPYRYTGSDIRYRDDSMPVGNVIIAVEGPSFGHEHNVVMEIARCAIGGWDRSQVSGDLLPTEVARAASKRRLCDAYKCFNINYKDTGLWGVQFISDVMSLDDMSIMVQGEWMYLCSCITEAEIERAKNILKTEILSATQSATASCHNAGRWALYWGTRPLLDEQLAAIDKVQVAQFREVCSRYLYDRCPTVAAVGRVEGLMHYQRIRSGMYWLRY